MSRRRVCDDELHAQFVTFSCYRRRRLLDHARARQVVISLLATELATHEGICCGFVVMPDHVHAIDRKDPFWQPRYYPFNLYSQKKATEKLDYMHLNPVRAGLVEKAVDWAWSSARYFDSGKSVGVPLEWIFS